MGSCCKMKVTITALVLTLSACVILGHRHRQKSGGLCLSQTEVAIACTSGTSLGEKLVSGLEKCARQPQTDPFKQSGFNGGSKTSYKHIDTYHQFGSRDARSARKDFGRRGGWSRRCPTVDRLLKKFESKLAKENCLINELGWSNGSDQENLAAITQDLMSLSGNMASDILSASKECTSMMVGKWMKKLKRCEKTYDTEDMAALTNAIKSSAGTKCFTKSFNKSCGEFVKTKIMSSYGNGSGG